MAVKRQRSRAKLIITMVLLLVSIGSQPAIPQTATADQIKAAYIFNFAKFVEWPAETFSNPDSPLNFCVLGGNAIADEMESLVAGKNINGHPAKVRRLGKLELMKTCHLVFLAADRGKQQQELFQAARGLPVLVVGDAPRFAPSGGMIGLITENGRVLFEVNPAPAEEARLKISSKLMVLARVVGRTAMNPSN